MCRNAAQLPCRTSALLFFHSINSLIETTPCCFPHMLFGLSALLIAHPTESHSPDSLIIFPNLHIGTVYFNTSRTGPSTSRFVSSLLTVGFFLNTGDGGRAAGGPVQEGFQCELTFLGVRIVQEQQADSSSGKSERSSLIMISIIQAICANRRCVFSSISSNRLVWQAGLLSHQSYLIIICAAFFPANSHQRWPLFCVSDDLCM